MWHGFSGQSGMMYSKIFVNFVKKYSKETWRDFIFLYWQDWQ